jgi:peptide deformylase
MPVRALTKMGNPILRRKAREVTAAELRSPAIQQLLDDMAETMRDASGVGLAAPQVGEGLRLIAVEIRSADEDDGEGGVPLTLLANPKIVRASKEGYVDWEGCLSIPNLRGMVPRHVAVEVAGLDRGGNPVTLRAEGFFARVLQHEIDHLDGILYLDRMQDFQTLTFMEEFEKYWLPQEEDAE